MFIVMIFINSVSLGNPNLKWTLNIFLLVTSLSLYKFLWGGEQPVFIHLFKDKYSA